MKLVALALAAVLYIPWFAQAHETCVTADDIAQEAASEGYPQAVKPVLTETDLVQAWRQFIIASGKWLPQFDVNKVVQLVAVVDLRSNTALMVPLDKDGCVIAHAHNDESGRTAVLSQHFSSPQEWQAFLREIVELADKSKI